MSGFTRLLVASDLSPRAERALARAARIAKEQNTSLTVLHVLEDAAGHDALTRQVEARLEDVLRQNMRRLSLQNNRTVAIRVAAGKPFVEIIRRARDVEADLIVVGAHGEHFLKDLFLGTTAEKVIRKGDRAVLVVKQPPRDAYRRVLVPVDFSQGARHALTLALELAPDAEFHVLHAYEGFEGRLLIGGVSEAEIARYRKQLAREARHELAAFLHDIPCGNRSVRQIIRHGRAPHVIPAVAKRLRADLVAVGTTGRTGLPYILLGSVAEHVLRQIPCDVLVARPEGSHFTLP